MRLTWLRFRREFASDWLSFQNESTLTGTDAGNYTFASVTGLSGTVTRAPLTVTANNNGKFASETDTIGYAGVSSKREVSRPCSRSRCNRA